MKTVCLFLMSIIFTSKVFSQDTMYTREGSLIPGKVVEISDTKIKYKKSSYLEGPLYVINKSTISKIEYKNGVKEVFPDEPMYNNSNDNKDKTPLTIVRAKNSSSDYTLEGALPYYFLWSWSGLGRNQNRSFIFFH